MKPKTKSMMKEIMRAKILREAAATIGRISCIRTRSKQIEVARIWKKSRFMVSSAKKPTEIGNLEIKSTIEIRVAI